MQYERSSAKCVPFFGIMMPRPMILWFVMTGLIFPIITIGIDIIACYVVHLWWEQRTLGFLEADQVILFLHHGRMLLIVILAIFFTTVSILGFYEWSKYIKQLKEEQNPMNAHSPPSL